MSLGGLRGVNGDAVFNDLAVRRGGRIEVPWGPSRVTIRHTSAVQAIREATAAPVPLRLVAEQLAEQFPGVGASRVRSTLAELVRQGFLISSLRAPFTVTDPLGYLVERLHEVKAGDLPSVAALVAALSDIQSDLDRHNSAATTSREHGRDRETISQQAGDLSGAGRSRLAVGLRLDCDVRLPDHVGREMARVATVLLRLSRQPAGTPAWQDFHIAFLARYGTATLVPVADVVDLESGLGYPAGYPGSVLPEPIDRALDRDERLLELAWQAVMDGRSEIVLTDHLVLALSGASFGDRPSPSHVEMAGRLHATSAKGPERGD